MGKMICNVCGKAYEGCRTNIPNAFQWRKFACSPECAREFIKNALESSGSAPNDTQRRFLAEGGIVASTDPQAAASQAETKAVVKKPEPKLAERKPEEKPVKASSLLGDAKEKIVKE